MLEFVLLPHLVLSYSNQGFWTLIFSKGGSFVLVIRNIFSKISNIISHIMAWVAVSEVNYLNPDSDFSKYPTPTFQNFGL